MWYVIVGFLCGLIGFISGALVYKNNVQKLTEEKEKLQNVIDTLKK